MLKRQGFKYEILPDGRQRRLIRKYCGTCRYVYNRTLAIEKHLYETDKSHRWNAIEAINRLPLWKEKQSWLRQCPAQAQQQSIRQLDRAYQNFFAGRSNFPRFRKKGENDSFLYPQAQQCRIDAGNNRIFFPKLGWVRFRCSRPILGTPKNFTVSIKAKRFYVSIQTEREVEIPSMISSEVGIDLGVKRLVTLSDGSFFEPRDLTKEIKKLKQLQRTLSRMKKFGKNWNKQKDRITREQVHIANCRKDYLHKISTKLAKNHGLIFVEDLKIANMTKSAKGTLDNPGKNVKAKSGLNRSILQQGWGMFCSMLEYKVCDRGGQVVYVDPRNTSRTCPRCQYVSKDNRKTQAHFKCLHCGFELNADHVGAINVLGAGIALTAHEHERVKSEDSSDRGNRCLWEPAESKSAIGDSRRCAGRNPPT